MSKDTINPKRYTVVEKLGKDVKEGEEIYRHTTGWEAWGKDDSFAAFNQGTTFLCRVPSSPVMSREEFFKLLEGKADLSMEGKGLMFEGYLIGTRSIVPEMMDEEIEKWVKGRGYYGSCTQEWHEGLEEGARWYREQIRSQINK